MVKRKQKKTKHYSSVSSGRQKTKYYKNGKRMKVAPKTRFKRGYKKQYGR